MHSKKPNHFIELFAKSALEESFGADFGSCCWFGSTEKGWVDSAGELVKKSRLESQLNACKESGPVWDKSEKKLLVSIGDIDIVVQVSLTRVVNKPTQDRIAETLEKSRLSSKDNFSASHDGLTGLFNRERFDEDLVAALSFKSSVSDSAKTLAFKPEVTYLISLDIDHFKNINDRNGHNYGDIALAAFAWRIEAAVSKFAQELASKPKCGVYRLGGEEFQVLMTGNIVIDDIEKLCFKLNDVISREILPSDDEWTSLSKRKAFSGIDLPHASERKVTVSIGASWATSSQSKNALEIAARMKRHSDIALYSAKLGGRNRTRLFPEILAKYGRIIEVHAETSIVAIDIGNDVGVQLGQEFFVVHPDFSGEIDFFSGEGRSRKRLGFYPRLRFGRIRVIEVQREVSFCQIVNIDERVNSFVEGSTLEEIPLGSISHLLSSHVSQGSTSSTGIEGVKKAFLDAAPKDSWIAVDFEITNFDETYKNVGSAAANLILARIFDFINNKFGVKSRIGYVEGGEIVAAVCVSPGVDLLTQLGELISEIDSTNGGTLGFNVGYCLPSEHSSIAVIAQNGIERSNAILEMARAARLVADDDRPIIKFSSEVVAHLISISRRDLKQDRGIADFELFNGLGFSSPSIFNQVGLCFAEMPKPDLVAAERYFHQAVELDSLDSIYWSNLGLVQFMSNNFSASCESFIQCLEKTEFILDNYEAVAFFAIYRSQGIRGILEINDKYPSLLEKLRKFRDNQFVLNKSDVDFILSQFAELK